MNYILRLKDKATMMPITTNIKPTISIYRIPLISEYASSGKPTTNLNAKRIIPSATSEMDVNQGFIFFHGFCLTFETMKDSISYLFLRVFISKKKIKNLINKTNATQWGAQIMHYVFSKIVRRDQ